MRLTTKRCFLALTCVFTVLVMTACGNNTSDKNNANDSINTESLGAFGGFSTESIEGDKYTQDIFSDKGLTMVNIWATYCSPCINEMPDLGEIAREYEDEDFQIVGIISDVYEANNSTALDILEKTNVEYLNLVLSNDMMEGYMRNVQVVPTTVFVDSNGNIVGEEYLGSKSKEQWIEIIDGLLEK